VLSEFLLDGETAAGVPDPRWKTGVQLMTAEPSVQAALLQGSREVEYELADVIAERIGVKPGELYPQLVAAAVGVALQIATEQWWQAQPPISIPDSLRAAIRKVSNLSS